MLDITNTLYAFGAGLGAGFLFAAIRGARKSKKVTSKNKQLKKELRQVNRQLKAVQEAVLDV